QHHESRPEYRYPPVGSSRASDGWQKLPCGYLSPSGPPTQRLPAGRQLTMVDVPGPCSIRPCQHGDFLTIFRASTSSTPRLHPRRGLRPALFLTTQPPQTSAESCHLNLRPSTRPWPQGIVFGRLSRT
ncbi:putative protein KRBA1, partial [Trichinella spiralis]|uniref:putative protein KRBA1 n=1 Tax=Trichinella spiralis TaxID=6334 RepID=UPI0001EFE2BF